MSYWLILHVQLSKPTLRLRTFNFDIIRLGCIYGSDSPVLKFISQLLVCPIGCWAQPRCFGVRLEMFRVVSRKTYGGVLTWRYPEQSFILIGFAMK